MITTKALIRSGIAVSATALVALTTVSCVSSSRNSSPEEIATSAPSVTYEYRNDDELVQANQRAVLYCNGYNLVPQPSNFSNDPNGGKVVIFDCVAPTLLVQPVQQFSPTQTYTYRTDQELLNLSRNAQIQCLNAGSQQTTSTTAMNTDGSRSVTFRCT